VNPSKERTMQKNYYLILGITSDASLDEVKAAFRLRARELHPDHSGLESGPFLEVQEAYGVLSDPARRRDYDRQGQAIVRRRPWGPSAEPLVRERPRGEPFAARRFRDVSLTESFCSHQPSFDELFERLWSNFDSVSRPKAEHLESLTVEVVVSPEEAALGGRVRVGIPARATCPACGGHGAVGRYECWRCEGRGALTVEYPVDVAYPPGLPDGYAMQLPLSHFGIESLYLTLLFRVSGGW
jgi:DnaJ-class molecular chaperone